MAQAFGNHEDSGKGRQIAVVCRLEFFLSQFC